MTLLLNLIRLFLAGLWTTILGFPLMAVVYATYWFGIVGAWFGRGDVLDRVLDANARLAGWVAQRLWTGGLLSLAGIRLRAREVVPVNWSAPHVICANHASIFDILALVRVVPVPFRFVAKRELVRWPIIGWLLRPAGQIVVDRSDRARALRSIAEAAVRKVRGQVIFFVEGTRSHTGQLLPFKKGAFHFAIDNGLPVLPTAIRGSYAVLAKLPWWRLRPGREIDITFCPTIEPPATTDPGARGGAVMALLDNTRRQISGALVAGEV